MILKNATLKYKGYDPSLLKPKSNKRICVSCDQCGRVRYINKSAYRDICKSCLSKGENNPMFGKKHRDETKQKMSGKNHPMYGVHRFGEDSPNWKGGFDKTQSHLTPISRCIQLNQRFFGSDGHHITKNVVIFIPVNLHKSIWHTLKQSKQGMNEINGIALDYLVGGD